MWAATEGDLSKSDLKCSEERIKGEKKTINKILNVSKFVSMFDKPKEKPALEKIDELMISYIGELTEFCEEKYKSYDFYNPANRLRKFIWDIFASNYIEVVKKRAYNQEEKFSEAESVSARWTLHFLIERFLVLASPIVPQISSTILKEKGISIDSLEFPSVVKGSMDLSLVDEIVRFNSEVWKTKKDKGISLRESIEGISIPEKLKDFEKDLKECHGLK